MTFAPSADLRVEKAVEVVVAGHICLDIIPTLTGGGFAFVPGKLIEAGRATIMLGGVVANVGVSLTRLGLGAHLIGKVADDQFGETISQLLEQQKAGLSGGLVRIPGESTSYSIILSPPGVDRMILHSPGCNATFTHADIDVAALQGASLLHFGYPPLMEAIAREDGVELVKLLRMAKQAGLTTSLDLSFPDMSGHAGKVSWPALLRNALPHVDLFLPSLEEIAIMLRPEQHQKWTANGREAAHCAGAGFVSDLGRELIAMGAKMVAIKMGHRGLYLRTAPPESLGGMGRASPPNPADWADRELWAPCYEASVVGATGAGDATIAGFLFALLRGLPVEDAITGACAVGACSVEAPDACSGIRSWQETQARVAAGWRQREDGPDSLDWTPAPGASRIWHGPGDARLPLG